MRASSSPGLMEVVASGVIAGDHVVGNLIGFSVCGGVVFCAVFDKKSYFHNRTLTSSSGRSFFYFPFPCSTSTSLTP